MERKLFELVLSIKRKCQANEDVIQNDLGISQAEFNALLVLNPDEEIFGNTLAERMSLSPSRSSRVLAKLTNNGYVNAVFKPNDRRSVLISLTKSGVQMKENILKRMEVCENRICGNFNQQQIDQIKKSLELLEKAL